MRQTLWTLIGLVIYCYFGYPVILCILAKIMARRVNKGRNHQPTVSMIISVCNEEDVIEQKIHNLLAQDYPREKIEILIGSDGSSDRTNEIIENFREDRIRFFPNNERRGKMLTLNDLVSKARHEIIVFTDARQMFAGHAVQELVNNFEDGRVGCVSGDLIFDSVEGGTGKGINLYWEYEKFMRSQESRLHSMLGATGAIYAIRRKLYVPVPQNVVLDDMFIPLKIIADNYRAVFDQNAKAFDHVASNPREEYRRKVRTLYGNYQIFSLFPQMFIPGISPIAIQLFSHKLLRVLIPFFLIAIFIISVYLSSDTVYKYVLYLQEIFYGMAFLGAILRNKNQGLMKAVSKICYVPYVFCLLNFSAFIGFLRFIGQGQDVTWQKAREA